MADGLVEAIFVAEAAAMLPRLVVRARAVAGLGLEGDRYYVNDARYVVSQGFGSPEHFLEMAKGAP